MSAVTQTTDTQALPAPVAGTPGHSAEAEAERLRVAWKHDQRAALTSRKLHGTLALLVIGIIAAVAGPSATLRLAGILVGLVAVALFWRSRTQHAVIIKPPTFIRALKSQSATEHKVAKRLDVLAQHGWIVRHDVRPGGWSGHHNVDHLLVGPGGVVVVSATRDALSVPPEFGPATASLIARVKPVFSVIVATGRTGGIKQIPAGADGSQSVPVTTLARVVSWVQSLPPVIPEADVPALADSALAALGTGQTATPAATAATPQNGHDGPWEALLATPTAPEPETTPAPSIDRPRLEAALNRIDGMPGLEHVAEQVRQFARRVMIDIDRHAQGLPTEPFEAHMIFTGPPGTGKTEIAEVVIEILAALKRLPSGHMVKANRAKLVGKFEGHTTDATRAVVEEAMGGGLFLDEAYSLTQRKANGGSDPFGSEAIEYLLEAMENNRDKLCVIAAGYADDMEQFLDSNPGLRSRFSKTITFEHYGPDTLLRIADKMTADRGYALDADARTLLYARLVSVCAHPPKGWANARSVRRLLDEAVEAQSGRLFSMPERSREDLQRLTAQDVTTAIAKVLDAPVTVGQQRQ